MTIKDLYLVASEQGAEPFAGLLIVMGILRTVEQGEIATLEGECASVERWMDYYGEITHGKVLNWLDNEMKTIKDLEVPEKTLVDYLTQDSD